MRGATIEMTKEVADLVMGSLPTTFRPRTLTRENDTSIYCYGRDSDINDFCDIVAKAKRRLAAAIEPATAAQISFLRDLIDADFGAATTIGARITPDLTKSQASRFINLMKTGV